MNLDRRTLMALGAMAPLAGRAVAASAKAGGDPLANTIVINTLGSVSFTPVGIEQAVASGVTATNHTVAGGTDGKSPTYFEDVVSEVAKTVAAVDANPRLLKILSAADIHRAKAEKKVGIIFGFQNAAVMFGRIERVDIFADFGLRIIQLTYNTENPLAGGSLVPEIGLKPFGRAVVDRLNARKIIVDLSHSGYRTCLDAAAYSKTPIAITHTACRAVADSPRNKTDEELRAVADKGGYVGIYFMPFLAIGRRIISDDVVAHLEHAMKVCGEDHVGIGTDGSVAPIPDLAAYMKTYAATVEARRKMGISAPGEEPNIPPFAEDLNGPQQFRVLARKLAARGHKQTVVDKLLGGNFLQYAQGVWGG